MNTRAEQTFFSDPALDRAVAMIMALAAELHVTNDRMRTLESILARRGIITASEIDDYEPSPEEQVQRHKERDAFVHALLSQLKGTQVSRGVG
ncbi:MAG: hypothetical protein ACI8PT_003756 [Gammaproteobacteria bacterium]|jgi:hypothetical protein